MIKIPYYLRRLLPLMALLIGNAIAHSLFMISFPIAGRVMGMSDWQTGAVLSISALTMLLVAPAWGKHIDKHGRKPAIQYGIVITALFLMISAGLFYFQPALALAPIAVFIFFLVSRITQSVAVSGLMPSAQAQVTDLTSTQNRVSGMGLMGATFGIGSLIGGTMAMTMGVTLLPHALIAIAVFMLISYQLFIPSLEESQQPENAPIAATGSRLPLLSIAPFVFITFTVIFVYSLLQQTLGLKLQDHFDFSPQEALQRSGALLTAAMAAMAICQGILSCLTIHHPTRLLLAGVMLGCVGLATLIQADTFVTLMLGIGMVGIAMGLLFPANLALLSKVAGPSHQAYAASINIIGKGLGMAVGPLLGALLYEWHPTLPLGLSLLLLGLLPVVLRSKPKTPVITMS